MNLRIAFAFIALCSLVLFMPAGAQNELAGTTSTIESESLQGAWEGVEVGREADGKATMTISGNTIHFNGANKKEWYKATFTLVSDSDPKQLASTITDCPAPNFIGKTAYSIYMIEDGKLTLTGNRPGATGAPKSFQSGAESRTFQFTRSKVQTTKAIPSIGE